MEARAEHKFARISPRKVKIVCDLIRDKDVELAKAHPAEHPELRLPRLLYKVLCAAPARTPRTTTRWIRPSLYVSKAMVTGGPIHEARPRRAPSGRYAPYP